MNRLQKRDQLIIEKFLGISSWEDRYKLIIQLGKSAEPLAEQYKTKKWLVKGCQSQVWLYAFQDDKGAVIFQADSDALITKGLIALLVEYYSGLSPKEIITHQIPGFLEKLELKNHLTPTRVGGLFSMVRHIQNYAQVFYIMSQNQKSLT